MSTSPSAHPADERRNRLAAKLAAKRARLFGRSADPRGRSQDQLQAEAAKTLEAQKAERAAFEQSLLNPPPPNARGVIGGRIRKDGKKISR